MVCAEAFGNKVYGHLSILVLISILAWALQTYSIRLFHWIYNVDDLRKGAFVYKDFLATRKLSRNFVLIVSSETVRPESKLLLQHLCSTQLRKVVFLCNVDATSKPSGSLPPKWKCPVEFETSHDFFRDALRKTKADDILVFANDCHRIFNGSLEMFDFALTYFQDKSPVERIFTFEAQKQLGFFAWNTNAGICVKRSQLERVVSQWEDVENKMPYKLLSEIAQWTLLWNQYHWTSFCANTLENPIIISPASEKIQSKQTKVQSITDKEGQIMSEFLEVCTYRISSKKSTVSFWSQRIFLSSVLIHLYTLQDTFVLACYKT